MVKRNANGYKSSMVVYHNERVFLVSATTTNIFVSFKSMKYCNLKCYITFKKLINMHH